MEPFQEVTPTFGALPRAINIASFLSAEIHSSPVYDVISLVNIRHCDSAWPDFWAGVYGDGHCGASVTGTCPFSSLCTRLRSLPGHRCKEVIEFL